MSCTGIHGDALEAYINLMPACFSTVPIFFFFFIVHYDNKEFHQQKLNDDHFASRINVTSVEDDFFSDDDHSLMILHKTYEGKVVAIHFHNFTLEDLHLIQFCIPHIMGTETTYRKTLQICWNKEWKSKIQTKGDTYKIWSVSPT